MFSFLGDIQPLSLYRGNNFSQSTSNTFSSNPYLKVPSCGRLSPRQTVSHTYSQKYHLV